MNINTTFFMFHNTFIIISAPKTCTYHMEYYSSRVEEMKRKGRLRHPNRLSKREMETITAFCDTILPSIEVSDGGNGDLAAFYGTSASMVGIPDKIGCLISGDLYHPLLWLLRVTLLLLSTRFGTFCVFGWASLSKNFPYFQKFADIEQAKREKLVLSLSLSSFSLHKMFYKCLKYFTVHIYFSGVNDKKYNPSWKALDYCGPDPDFLNQCKQQQQNDKTEDCVGPLHNSLLHIDSPIDFISQKLKQSDFPLPTFSSTYTSSPILTLNCDAVVIGSGSGGSVVAGLLAVSGYKVLVLEKGNYFARNNLSLIEGVTTNEMYEGRALIATDNVGTLLLAGSTVGGGSTVNWSASIRTPNHVRDEWAKKYGLEMFSSKMFDRALNVVCDKMDLQEVDEEGFNNEVLRRGCEELGYKISKVPCNAPSDHYCGWCHLGCKNGKKQSTQETWLKDLSESGNGLILPGCNAVNITQDGKISTGVIAESIETKQKFAVRSKVTIIACGALNTPSLLKRSGLKNKNIGRNLHIHPCVLAWGYFPEENRKKSYEGGILTSMCTEVANFDSSGYGAILQTPALHPGMFSVVTPWMSALDYRERMMKFARTAHIFTLARDKGAGTVNYPWSVSHHLTREDDENLVKGLEIGLRVLVAAGAEEVGTHHCGGQKILTKGNEKGLERLIEDVRKRGLRDMGTPVSSAHQMGSCRMGVTEELGAVKPNGETWEVEGLFVADTSVFPTALGVNPMVTVQAIAYCTGQTVLKALERKQLERKLNGK